MQIIQIEIIRNTVAAGRPVFVGDVVPVTVDEAKILYNLGKARPYEAPEEDAEVDIEQVISAIASLDLDDPDHFTTAGKPRTDALEEILGKPVSAALRDKAFEAFEESE